MKIKYNYSLIGVLAALVVGLVLLLWADMAVNYMIISIGILLFIMPGLFAFISYYLAKERPSKHILLMAIGSFLFGLFLVIMPSFFADILMIILGLVLLLDGVGQIVGLISARRNLHVDIPLYMAVPAVVLVGLGLFSLFAPMQTRNTLLTVIGVANLLYAFSELFIWFKYKRNSVEEEVEETSVVEVVDAEEKVKE